MKVGCGSGGVDGFCDLLTVNMVADTWFFGGPVFWSTPGVAHEGIVKGKLVMLGGTLRKSQQTPMKVVYWYQKESSVIKATDCLTQNFSKHM